MNFNFAGCEAGVEYFTNTDLNTFAAAQSACEGEGGQLAIPASSDRLVEMKEAYDLVFQDSETVFIGLQGVNGIGGTDGTSFIGVDGQVNAFSFVGQGEGPWATGQPDNSGNCGAMDSTGNVTDEDCNQTFPSICEKYCAEIAQENVVLGDCVEDVQLFMVKTDVRSFDEAQANCKSVNIKANLAVPKSFNSFEQIQQFYLDNRLPRLTFLGLRDFIGSPTANDDTTRFLSILTGVQNTFTSGVAEVFPWNDRNPNNNGGGEKDCVCLDNKETDPLLVNSKCSDVTRISICEMSCESTGSPTLKTGHPTSNPTQNPTLNPTENPTQNPTSNPTENPTGNPTQNPTLNPTQNPTGNPTESPVITGSPTTAPTENPTRFPTTGSPTNNPTTLAPTTLFVASENDAGVDIAAVAGGIVGVCVLFAIVGAFLLYRNRKRPPIKNSITTELLKAEIDGSSADEKKPIDEELGGMQMSTNPLTEVAQPQVPKLASAPPVISSVPPLASTQRKTTEEDIATLDALVAANTPAKATPPVISSAPLADSAQRKTTEEDIATLDALVAANTPGTPIDEDVAMLDNLVAQNMKKPATVDEDVAALDALVAANTNPNNAQENPPPMARPESAYIKSAELKPEDRRSIFAPSSEYIKKAADAKRKRDQPDEDDDDDLDI